MTGSLRGRLLVWYTAMLTVVIVAFGAFVCYLAWRAKLADIDASLRAQAEALATGLTPAAAGTFDLTLPGDGGGELTYHALWAPGGDLIDRSDPALDIPHPGTPGLRTRDGRRELTMLASGAYVLVGRPLDAARAEIAELAATMAAAGMVAVVVSFLGGLYLISRALVPVKRINDTARAMVEGDFSARVPIEATDTELGQLARAINEAFDGLHAALERQRRFTADASHELRTPLAVISTELQWALGRDRQAGEYRGALEVCRRASIRMQAIVERLLALARAEAPPDTAGAAEIRLDEVVESVVRDLRRLADGRSLEVAVDAAAVACLGDRDRLIDAVTNVVMNAIQYTPSGGRIRIDVRDTPDHAAVVVTDTGVGIAAQHLPYVFEPFFRADPVRTGPNGGSGLGLAVARATVRQHGGDVSCASTPGRGTTVTITMPRAGSVAPPARV